MSCLTFQLLLTTVTAVPAFMKNCEIQIEPKHQSCFCNIVPLHFCCFSFIHDTENTKPFYKNARFTCFNVNV
jgi:hypothetical protein